MNRVTVFPGQLPLETDLLHAQQFGMIALGKFVEAILGTGTAVDGLGISPTNPASMSVNIAPGSIYELENVESTAWSSLPVDTRPLVKQGINLDTTALGFAAPSATGQSQAFLIQAAYAEDDGAPKLRPYFDAADPEVAFQGPGNDGNADNTQRQATVALTTKAGVAMSGTPTVPAPDPGWVGLYVVTIAAGQTTISGGNITPYAAAPFITPKLPDVAFNIQSGGYVYARDTGTSGHLAATVTPAPRALVEGMCVRVRAAFDCPGPTDFSLNGSNPLPVVTTKLAALVGGQYLAGAMIDLTLDANGRWQMVGVVTPTPAAPVIPAQKVYSSGEGVIVGADGTVNLDVVDLAENDSVSAGDLFPFYQVVAEGGEGAGHHRRVSFQAFANAVLALVAPPPTSAATAAYRYGNDSAGVGNNTLATYPLTGLSGSFGTGDANKFTFSKSGIYAVDAILQARINVNNNGAGGPVNTARAYSGFFFYKDGTQLLEYDQAGTALNYVCTNTADISLTSYFAAGETVSFAMQSTGDGFNANNTYLGGGTTVTITKIA